MTQMTTAEAADRLGVSQRQVQRLVGSGELPARRTAGDAWVVDALTVNAMMRARPERGRPWLPGTAWAALWRLSGLDANWLDRRTTRRLTERLSSLGAGGLLHATRRRAVVRCFRVSDPLLAELSTAVVRSGTSAMTPATFGMEPDSAHVDGYCDDDALPALMRAYDLVEDPRGNATLRAAPFKALPVEGRNEMPLAVVAADLAESFEARERSAGLRVLEGMLRVTPASRYALRYSATAEGGPRHGTHGA